MAVEVETLLIRLEATQRKFEKQMKAANRQARQASQKIESRFDRMNKNVSRSLANMGKKATLEFKNLVVPALALLSVERFTAKVRETIGTIAILGDLAQQAGTTAEGLQKLTVAGEALGVSQDALVDGLKELKLRGDEFAVTAKGPAAEAFDRLGLSQAQVNDLLAKGDSLFFEVIKRMEKLGQAANIRVSDELFGGTAGEQFVRLVEGGTEKVRRLGEEAARAGKIFGDDVVEDLRAARAQLAELDRTYSTMAAQGFLAAGPLLIETARFWAGVAESVKDLANSLRDVDSLSAAALRTRIAETNEGLAETLSQIKALEAQVSSLEGDAGPFARDPTAESQLARQDLIEANKRFAEGIAERERLQARLDEVLAKPEPLVVDITQGTVTRDPVEPLDQAPKRKPDNRDSVETFLADLRQQIELEKLANEERAKAEALIQAQTAAREAGRRLTIGEITETIRLADAHLAVAAAAEERARILALGEDFERRKAQLIAETELLEREAGLIGLSASEADRARIVHELLAAAKAAEIPITKELVAEVEKLADAYARAGQSVDELGSAQADTEDLMQDFKQAAGSTLKGFINDLKEGKSVTEALGNALSNLADQLLNIALNIALNAAFGGAGFGFKDGGAVKAAGGGLIRGPGGPRDDKVPARLSDGEFVVNAKAARENLGLLRDINEGRLARFRPGGLGQPLAPLRAGGGTGGGGAASSAPPPAQDVKVINTFDADSFLSEAMNGRGGEKTILNFVRSNRGAMRSALNLT